MWSIGYRIVCGGVSGFNAPSVLVIELLGGDGNCGSIESYVCVCGSIDLSGLRCGCIFAVRREGRVNHLDNFKIDLTIIQWG